MLFKLQDENPDQAISEENISEDEENHFEVPEAVIDEIERIENWIPYVKEKDLRKQNGFLYRANNYLYSINRRKANRIFLTCRNGYKKGENRCFGRASINTITDLLKVTRPHNHDTKEEEKYYEFRSLERKMKDQLKPGNVLRGGMKNSIFNKCSREASEVARNNVQWKRLYPTLYNIKRKYQPPIPKIILDYVQGLKANPATYGKNFLDSYEVDDEPAGVMFGDKELIAWLIQVLKEVGWDATFKIVPRKLFYQAFTIHVMFEGRAWPLVLVLMARKSREHYDAAFEKVVELIPEFKPERAMADAESAPRSSAKFLFDDLIVNICWFHYCQAIIQNVKSNHLLPIFKKSDSLRKWVQRIMAVPLLPPHLMAEVYEELLQVNFRFRNR